MDRRNFFRLFSAGVAGIALDQAIPLNRVWSFPQNIRLANSLPADAGIIGKAFGFEWTDEVNVGSLTPIRMPVRFEIGDIITVNDWPGLFVVSRIHPDETIDLYGANQRLLRRGVSSGKCAPFLVGDFLGKTTIPEGRSGS